MNNRSVPVDVILPHVVYKDVAGAIEWLTRVFGFVEHYRYGPPEKPQGAQLRRGGAWIMLASARPGRSSPGESGSWTQMLTVFVDDLDQHYETAVDGGAMIVEEINETLYGERQYEAVDLEGHKWLFSQHCRDVDPRQWATVKGS